MSLPYMRLYPQDYLQDTNHLTTEEHGAYLLLILNYWQTEKPLKDDDKRLAGICRADAKQWASIRLAVAEMFVIKDGYWKHKRIEAELTRIEKKSKAAKEAGKLGGLTKHRNQQLASKRLADSSETLATQTQTQTHTQTHLKEKKRTQVKKHEEVIYPDALDQAAWAEWIQHRKEIKNPMTALAERKGINKLLSLANGVSQQDIIDHCIAGGWSSLHAPNKSNGASKPVTAANRFMENLKNA